MLLKNDLDTFDLQDFCVETLEQDATYTALCTTLVGDKLNFETDTRIDDYEALPSYPFCIAFAGDEEQDLRQQEWGHEYEVALVFGMEDERTSITENNVKKYTDTRNLEKVAKEGLKVILDKMRRSGINGDYEISITEASGVKTPTGEESDINYILSLKFAYLDDINK